MLSLAKPEPSRPLSQRGGVLPLVLAVTAAVSAGIYVIGTNTDQFVETADANLDTLNLRQAAIDSVNDLSQLVSIDVLRLQPDGTFAYDSLPEDFRSDSGNRRKLSKEICDEPAVALAKEISVDACKAQRIIAVDFTIDRVDDLTDKLLIYFKTAAYFKSKPGRNEVSFVSRFESPKGSHRKGPCPWTPTATDPTPVNDVYLLASRGTLMMGWTKIGINKDINGGAGWLPSDYQRAYRACKPDHNCKYTQSTPEFTADNHLWRINNWPYAGAIVNYKDTDRQCELRLRQFRKPVFNSGCYAAGTPIQMADGSTRPVETLAAGDRVWNPLTQRAAAITEVTAGPEAAPLSRVQVGNRDLTVTRQHPFLTTEDGLVAAKDLRPGMVLVGDQGGRVDHVTELEAPRVASNVYNFSLDTDSLEAADHAVVAAGITTGDLWLQRLLAQDGQLVTAP